MEARFQCKEWFETKGSINSQSSGNLEKTPGCAASLRWVTVGGPFLGIAARQQGSRHAAQMLKINLPTGGVRAAPGG
jgi:hypothetical protein